MDTRFWGPSAWRLFHLQAEAVSAGNLKLSDGLKTFFTELPYVLPCKYCRQSLAEYYSEYPFDTAWKEARNGNMEALAEWIYKIHNLVNAKLRQQKLSNKPDPSYEEVREKYGRLLAEEPKFVLGFDFFKSVAATVPKPDDITNAPRIEHLRKWWLSIDEALPFPAWREKWASATRSRKTESLEEALTEGPHKMLLLIWSIYKEMGCPLQTFEEFRKDVSVFKSSCSTGRTCRANKARSRKSVRQRRRRTLRQTGGFL